MNKNTCNRFANKLPAEQERKLSLYLLDSDPLHSLQVFGVPQYLPCNIYGYNSISSTDLLCHHERVKELIQTGNIDLTKFDQDGLEDSLVFVFGFDVPAKTLQEAPKKYSCLQIYYAAPVVEDVPPGVFGASESTEKSEWTELQRPLKKTSTREWQRSNAPSSLGSGGAAREDEDGPTRVPSPETDVGPAQSWSQP